MPPSHDPDLRRELHELRACLLDVADDARDAVRGAVECLVRRDLAWVERVEAARGDVAVRQERCDSLAVALLVRRSPIDADLRQVLTALKVGTDLERVADLAVDVVHRARSLCDPTLPVEVADLGRAAAGELATALSALRDGDASRARQLHVADGPSNQANLAAIRRLHALTRERPDDVDEIVALTATCRSLERIGDHAVMVARRVVYAVEGVVLPPVEG